MAPALLGSLDFALSALDAGISVKHDIMHAAGFFKGVGKGVIGAVAQPTSVVLDFASSAFEAIVTI